MNEYTLFKVCYGGSNYHGSQRQPGFRTIEGEILKALHIKGYINEIQYEKCEIHSAGRTDAGVHARGMTFGVFNQRDVFHPIEVNTALPDDIFIWSSGRTELNEGVPIIHPRYQALQRHYKYYFVDTSHQLDTSLVHQVMKKLEGTHDFRNMSKFGESIDTQRTVDKIMVKNTENVWVFDFKARSFLWHQIRKMMRVILMIGSHRWPLEIIDSLLDPENREYASKIEPVAPDGLILWDITYPKGMKFQECEKSIHKLTSRLNSWLEEIELKNSLLSNIKNSFQ